LKRNKKDSKRGDSLIYGHDPLDGVGIELEGLSLDERKLEAILFLD